MSKTIWKKTETKMINMKNAYAVFLRYDILKAQKRIDMHE